MSAARKTVLTPSRVVLAVLAAGAVGIAGAGVVVYLQREAIGVHLAFDYLRAAGVPAEIRLDRLDLGGAVGSIRIGPADRPDLTVDRVEARFGALPAPWKGVRPPPLRSLTLVRPVLRVAWRNGRLDFGALQPLVERALHAKGGGGPPPDLHVQGGRILISSPYGAGVLALDGTVEGGRVRVLHLRLEPADLSGFGVRLAGVQGVVSGQATGGGLLHLAGAFGAERGSDRRAAARGLTLTFEGVAPNGTAAGAEAGTRLLDATARLRAERLALRLQHGGPMDVQGGDVALDVNGEVDRSGLFSGRLHAVGRAARLERGGLQLAAARVELQSASAHARTGLHGLQAGGPYQLSLAAAGGRLHVAGLDAALLPARLDARGRIALDGPLRLDAAGSMAGGLSLAAGDADALGRRALGAVDPAAAASVARALRRVEIGPTPYGLDYEAGEGTLRFGRGLRLALVGGSLALAPTPSVVARVSADGTLTGAGAVTLQVQGLPDISLDARRVRRSASGALDAEGAMKLQGDLGPVQGARLAAAGALREAEGRWSFVPADCLQLAAAAVRSGAQVVATGAVGQACPQGDLPLAAWGARGWRVRLQAKALAATLPAVALKAAIDEAAVTLDGAGRSVSGSVRLHQARLDDTGPEARVRPLLAGGAVDLAGRAMHGRFTLALAQGSTPLGSLTLSLQGGAGEAALTSLPLRFAQGAMQPGDIVPSLARVLPQADGMLQVAGRYRWSPGSAAASSGEIDVQGLSYRSPAGRLDGVEGRVRLVSLLPAASAPGQVLTAAKLEMAIPLTGVSARFTLLPGRLALGSASANAAGGRIGLGPMSIPLAPATLATSGVLELTGVELEQVIQTLNLAQSVTLKAKVDGRLPFALRPLPGGDLDLRITEGRVAADGPGMLTIARKALTGAVTTGGATDAQPNAVQDFAYQALEDLAFTRLEADVSSRSGGRLGVVFHVVGRHDPPVNRPTRIGLFALLRGRAFDKPLPLPKGTPVDLTLDTSLNLDDILNSYMRLGAANRGSATPGSAPVQK